MLRYLTSLHRLLGAFGVYRIRPVFFGFALLVLPLVHGANGEAPSRSALPDALAAGQLLWEIELGSHQYTVPRVDGKWLYIGVNDLGLKHPVVQDTGGGILMCLERSTGKKRWQLPIPRYKEGAMPPFHFNHWKPIPFQILYFFRKTGARRF